MGVKEYLMEIGEQRGLEIGLEVGLEEGRQVGREEANKKIVRNLLIRGESTSQIALLASVNPMFARSKER